MKISQDLIFVPRTKVMELLDNHIKAAYDIIKQTYLDFVTGKSLNPPSSFLWYDQDTNSRIIGLAAYLGDKKSYPGIKWIASCPQNIDHGIPRASAVLILNDFSTGFPVAIMEGAVISAVRTALSGILALEYLHPSKTIPNLGIMGGGNLAVTFLKCLDLLGWNVDNCHVYDTHPQAKQMEEKLETKLKIVSVTQDQLLKNNDVVLFTTTATKPYIDNTTALKPNAVILNLSLRDLSPEVILSAFNIVDDVEHVLAANTSPHLAFMLSGNKNFIAGNIMQLVLGELDVPDNKLKIFSPMGMGILDIALANLILADIINSNDQFIVREFFK